jgi:hypothetical protein
MLGSRVPTQFLVLFLFIPHAIFRVSNDRTTDERIIGKDLEGNVLCLIEVISRNLPRGTEEKHERISDVHAEIRTEHLSNSSLEYYLYTSLVRRIYISGM